MEQIHEAPGTPSSGPFMSPFMWGGLSSIGAFIGFFHWHRLRKKRMTLAFLRAMEKQYKHQTKN
jgi:hypothetical protein